MCIIYVYTRSCVCTCIFEVCGGQRSIPSVYLNHTSILIWLGLFGHTKPQRPFSLCLVSPEVIDTGCHSELFTWVLGTWVRVLGLVQQAFNWLNASSLLSVFLIDVLLVHTGYLDFNTGSSESYSLDLTEPCAHRLGRYIFSINFLREGNRF